MIEKTDSAISSGAFRVERVAAPLRHQVIESIRNAIVTGYFKPGERLLERRLCEMIGVSRTLVREALRQLESEGLIEVVAHRGHRRGRASIATDIHLIGTESSGVSFAENFGGEYSPSLSRDPSQECAFDPG